MAKHGQSAIDEAEGVRTTVSVEDDNLQSNRIFKRRQGRSRKKFEEALKEIRDYLPEYIGRPSKWSGRVRVVSRFTEASIDGVKNKNCDISVTRQSKDCTLIHEMIHSTSASYYDPEEYMKYRLMEEASVELLTRAICKDRGISYTPSYSGFVKNLVAVGKYLGYTSDMDFAKDLMKQPLANRHAWLLTEVDNKLKQDGVPTQDYGQVIDYILELGGPMPNV